MFAQVLAHRQSENWTHAWEEWIHKGKRIRMMSISMNPVKCRFTSTQV
jgi:hypothetical protein